MEDIVAVLKHRLIDRFRIGRSNLEFELSGRDDRENDALLGATDRDQ